MECIRKMGWVGKCEKEATVGDFCDDHSKDMCKTCGIKIATCECVEASSLVCGNPLCNDCKCKLHDHKGA